MLPVKGASSRIRPRALTGGHAELSSFVFSRIKSYLVSSRSWERSYPIENRLTQSASHWFDQGDLKSLERCKSRNGFFERMTMRLPGDGPKIQR